MRVHMCCDKDLKELGDESGRNTDGIENYGLEKLEQN